MQKNAAIFVFLSTAYHGSEGFCGFLKNFEHFSAIKTRRDKK